MTMSTQTKEKIELLNQWIDECAPGRMVFFGGAGVSTESGIPDFRSPDGLYAQKYKLPNFHPLSVRPECSGRRNQS